MLASWHFFSAQALNTTHFHSQAQGCQVNTPPCLDALSEWVQRETSKSFAFSTNFCTSKTLKEKKIIQPLQCCILTGNREVTLLRFIYWVKEPGSFLRSQGSLQYENRGELADCLLTQHKSLWSVSECLVNITQLNIRPAPAGKIQPL